MKAIILAAGEGKRMRPFTAGRPKPMLNILKKPLLYHIIESLPEEVEDIIMVIGYKRETIRQYFGNNFLGRTIHYVEQDHATGTADALLLCERYLDPNERFLVLNADDLHEKKGIERLLKFDRGLLVHRVSDPTKFGVVEIDGHHRIVDIVEKPEKPKTNLVAIGVYLLDHLIFNYFPEEQKGEYYLTTMIQKLVRDFPVHAVESHFWLPIGYPEDLISASDKVTEKQYSESIKKTSQL